MMRWFMLCLLCAALPLTARGQELLADLSAHHIGIVSSYHGEELLLFGMLEQPLAAADNLVVVVRGPERSLKLFRVSRWYGLWLTLGRQRLDGMPGFYHVYSTAPLEQGVAESVRRRHGLGFSALRTQPLTVPSAFRTALITEKMRQGLYRQQAGGIFFLGDRLFRLAIPFPQKVPVGAYQVEVYLLRGGLMRSAQTTPLSVSKEGLGAEIAWKAKTAPTLYGVIAVLLALLGGWFGGWIFKKR
jgi:uncharacterized protein (TIGR02186 family)